MQVLWPEDLGLQCLRPRSYDTMIWNCVKFPMKKNKGLAKRRQKRNEMKTGLPEAGKGFQKRNGVCPRRARLMKNENGFAHGGKVH